MKLVLTLLVRDEEDVLAANLDFHFSHGVDFAIVTDNASVDATPEILEAYRRSGLVEVITERGTDYAQSRWVTRMARSAAVDYDADWVINADADEFWCARSGDLKDALGSLAPRLGGLRVPRKNMVARPGGEGPFSERMIYRDENSWHSRGAPIGPKVCHRAAADITVAMGNHAFESARLGAVSDEPLLLIRHLPMRSYEQYRRTIANGGSSLVNSDLPSEMGWHWREDFERLEQGRLEAEYRRRTPTDAEIDDGLRDGRYVQDTWLRDRLKVVSRR